MNLLSDAAQSQTWKQIKPLIVRFSSFALNFDSADSKHFQLFHRPRARLSTSPTVSPSSTPRTPELRLPRTSMSSFALPKDPDELSELFSRRDVESTLPSLSGKTLPERLWRRLVPSPSLSVPVTLTRPPSKRRSTPTFTVNVVSSWEVSVSLLSNSTLFSKSFANSGHVL